MKKLALIFLLAVLSISLAFGQTVYGLRGGLNISNFNGDPDPKVDAKIGFHGGLMAQARMQPPLILQSELIYTQRGAQDEYIIPLLEEKAEIKMTLHYLELPFFVKLDLGEGNLKFQPYLGPELRYLIKGNSTVKVGSSEATNEIEGLKDFDFGLGFGVDVVFNTNILIGARYSLGLTNIDDNGGDLKNKSIMVNMGVLY